ncbi:MAG TPA: choice-of-anchor D domain-containing protein [Terriglobales bacterium]|nr:choice-of-anchor D domain-containing protein [Terriglobales bacterium]
MPNGSSCSIAVTFSPSHAGLRQDAIIVKDSGGNVLAEGFVYGTGHAPQVTFNPGVLQILYTGENNFAPGDTFTSLTSDGAGNLYLAKGNFNVILKFAAGSSTPVIIAGQRLIRGTSGDGGPATSALLTYPTSLTVDAAGNLYFVDGISGYGQVIRRIDGTTGIITAVPMASSYPRSFSSLAVDSKGDLYVGTQALFGQPEIQKVDASTYVSTIIAGGTSYSSTGDGGPAASATFAQINGLAVDSAGNLFVADYVYIRRIDVTTQIITSIAGNGAFGTSVSGTPAATAPVRPHSLAIDPLNNLYFTSFGGSSGKIYKIDPLTGLITAFAGGQQTNYLGFGDGDLSNVADFVHGNNIAFDASGNYYVATSPSGQLLSELVEVNTTSPGYRFLSGGSYFGNPSPLPVTVNNIGNRSLSVSSETLTGSFSETPSGAPVCNFPGSMAADSACSFMLSVISGSDNADGLLSLTDNSLNQSSASQQATLTFIYPVVTATPASVTFAPAEVATPHSLNLNINNTSRVPYTFDHAAIQGPNASDFSVGTTCYGIQNPILQGANCYLPVTFTPSAAGTRTATLMVYGSTRNPLSIPLTGTAAVGSLSLSANSLTFVQTQWQTSTSQNITVTNTGVVPITFSTKTYPGLIGGAFLVNDFCSIYYRIPQNPLAPGQSCQISVSFYGRGQPGQFSAIYPLSTSIPGPQPSISIKSVAGVTAPALTFGQSPLVFTAVANQVSSSVPLEIKNSGSTAASITSIALTGAQASDFRQFNNCPASLPAGQSCVVWVSYAPTAASPANSTAVVTVASNGSLPQSEPVSGTIVQNVVARVVIDAPAPSTVPVSGTINVFGWTGQDGQYLGGVALSVDNMIVGYANLNLARPDVCRAYPQIGNCPNSGWSYQLDTTAIADGVHTLTIAAGTSSNSDSSASVQFTVANGSSSRVPILFIDSPTPGQNLSGTVTIFGWALSKENSSTGVSVSVDGISYSVKNNARPDVCAAYDLPSSQCNYVGWSASVNAESLPVGDHTLTVTATGNSFNYNQSPPTAVKTVHFNTQTSSNPIRIYIDQPSVNQTVSHSFTATGWAVTSRGAPVVNITAWIDGSQGQQIIAYGFSRPDVCSAYPDSLSCPNVGWSGTINLNQVSNGVHAVTITARARDGSFSTITRQITVDNVVSAASDQLLLFVDSPRSNSTISGVVPVLGWVVDGLTSYPEVDLDVDGIPVAVTSPQLARPDVCNAYPWAQGCTGGGVGWASQIDTTLLTDGTHTLNATSTSATGKRTTTSVQFVADNSPGRRTNGQWLYIDSPAAGATSSGALSISGWAVSQTSPVTEVAILVDGVLMGAAQYGFARQDVCIAYPNSVGCPNVGWSYLLDTRTLADGPHTVEAIEETASGNAVISQKFNISNASLSSSVQMFIDTPASNVTLSGTYLVSGWAIDDNDSIASVAIAVDNLPQGFASYGGQRTDVCNMFPGRAGCPNVGWSSTLDTTQFQNGSHTLAVTVKSTHGDVLTLTRVIQTAN